MNSQKIENILNLSLNSSQEEREKSRILEVGFNKEMKTWEVIVKYHGDIQKLADNLVKIEILLNGFAIITIPEILLESLSSLEEIEYITKPQRLVYDGYEAKRSSGILPVIIGNNTLTGKGVIVAVIDSGIDYYLSDFQNQQGSRILYLWDQTLVANEEKGWLSPRGFQMGVEFTKSQIDAALATGNRTKARKIVPQVDILGHGTAVAGIAAGCSSSPLYQGIAPGSDIIVVKLGMPMEQDFPRTTELMRAITYVLKKAGELQKPIAINLSLGNSYGAHDKTSLLERFIDNASEVNRTVICVGSGNEAASGGHTSSRVTKKKNVELCIGNFERTISIQLFKDYSDEFTIEMIAPNGEKYEISYKEKGKQTWKVLGTTVLIYVGAPTPYSVSQEIFFDLISNKYYIDSGVWTIVLTPVKIVVGVFHMYLTSASIISSETRFLSPSSELTLTIPATASKVITVGAYNSIYNAYADFSGRGQKVTASDITVTNTQIKPDLVAPGVGILAPFPGGAYESVNGTSFSTPVVTGSAALLMQWGIVKGNDPYLYGDKVKAYLRKGARKLPEFEEYPNPQVGWGALCVKDSLPL